MSPGLFVRDFRRRKPIFNYKCLLGYRKGADGEPEIVPEEASIVERIFNMYLSGETINRISTKLREEKSPDTRKTIFLLCEYD